MQRVQQRIGMLWRASRPLTATGVVLLVAFAGTVIGLAADPRIIGGAPAWLKPAKFAISTAIYVFTFAAILTQLEGWPRLARIAGWTTATASLLEVVLISVQAQRGAASHFNSATRLDMTIYMVMALGILVVLVMAVALSVALFRQRFADPGIGWALRCGMLLTILGASTAGLMTRPTAAQMERVHATGEMPVAGAHTVGAPDGAPGLPGTGWSRDHGDLRVPHFVGLHAVQVLPLLALALRRRRGPSRRQRLIGVSIASYASLFGLVLWQALRGEPVLSTSAVTAAALATWLAATVAALLWADRHAPIVDEPGEPNLTKGRRDERSALETLVALGPRVEPARTPGGL